MGATVTGWGTAVPDRIVTNEELARRVGVDEAWIFQRTGILARHVADAGETTSALAFRAGRDALAMAELDPSLLDAVVVATCTPDRQLPATACLVQAALGASRAAAFDIQAGCSGFLYALSQATAMIDSQQVMRVLVIGADCLSLVTDYLDPRSCILFGDGAGAIVVEMSLGGSRLGPFLLRSDGRDPDLLCIPNETGLISMQGRDVYRRAVDEMSASIIELATATGMTLSDVDLIVAHQANARILAAVAERIGVSLDLFQSNIARYGNTSAASIPLELADAAGSGRLAQGDRVVLAAFGAGFTWGAGLLRWGSWTREVQQRPEVLVANA